MNTQRSKTAARIDEALAMRAAGHLNQEIADALEVSLATITHLWPRIRAERGPDAVPPVSHRHGSRKTYWTDELLDELVRRRKEGTSWAQLGRELGRERDVVRQRVLKHRPGSVSTRPATVWTDRTRALAHTMHDALATREQIAAACNVSPGTVDRWRAAEGLRGTGGRRKGNKMPPRALTLPPAA